MCPFGSKKSHEAPEVCGQCFLKDQILWGKLIKENRQIQILNIFWKYFRTFFFQKIFGWHSTEFPSNSSKENGVYLPFSASLLYLFKGQEMYERYILVSYWFCRESTMILQQCIIHISGILRTRSLLVLLGCILSELLFCHEGVSCGQSHINPLQKQSTYLPCTCVTWYIRNTGFKNSYLAKHCVLWF